MKYPRLRKNPLLSLYLSGASAIAGSLRGWAVAETRRQTTTAMMRGTKEIIRVWNSVLGEDSGTRKSRKHR